MTKRQIAEALELILAPHALSAEVEYELEDLGLVVIDHRPYAHLTQAGVAFLAEQKLTNR